MGTKYLVHPSQTNVEENRKITGKIPTTFLLHQKVETRKYQKSLPWAIMSIQNITNGRKSIQCKHYKKGNKRAN